MDRLIELKAKAYDMISAIERGQLMLKQLNNEIAAESKKQEKGQPSTTDVVRPGED